MHTVRNGYLRRETASWLSIDNVFKHAPRFPPGLVVFNHTVPSLRLHEVWVDNLVLPSIGAMLGFTTLLVPSERICHVHCLVWLYVPEPIVSKHYVDAFQSLYRLNPMEHVVWGGCQSVVHKQSNLWESVCLVVGVPIDVDVVGFPCFRILEGHKQRHHVRNHVETAPCEIILVCRVLLVVHVLHSKPKVVYVHSTELPLRVPGWNQSK